LKEKLGFFFQRPGPCRPFPVPAPKSAPQHKFLEPVACRGGDKEQVGHKSQNK